MKKKLLFIVLFISVCSIIVFAPLAGSAEDNGPNEDLAGESIEQPAEMPVRPSFLDMMFFTVNTSALGEVDKQLNLFSEGIKERFALYLRRSGRYIGLMKAILVDNGLPEDLAFLPLIESGFSPHAKSRMRAVGPWQFIASTARLYGLKINWWVDERKDPVKSTEAAAQYLTDLYNRFGSWSLAMAAYNAGEGKILRALKKTKGEDFWDIHKTRHIRPETKNYIPKFIAARLIAENPEEYGFQDISYEEPFIYDEVTVDGPVELGVIAECAGTTVDEIKELNPELIRWCTPPDVKEYTLRIPAGSKVQFREKFSNIPEADRYSKCTVPYTVKKGDTLNKISRKTGVPLTTILALNSITKKSRLKAGQIIYLPLKKG